MPIYDYTCSSCGHLTEVIHGINDDGPRFCPSCGAEGTMRKGFSTPAVHFKGSGWARKERSSGGGGRSPTSRDGSTDAPAKSGAQGDAGKGAVDATGGAASTSTAG